MKNFLALLAHLLTTVAKLLGPGGTRAVVTESLLMKHQPLLINRSRRRALKLSALDRILLGFWSLFLSPHRIRRAAVIIRPSPLLRFHEAPKEAQVSSALLIAQARQVWTKGPSPELIRAIVELK